MVVVLAAGKGSRFSGLPEGTSKCSTRIFPQSPMTTISYLIDTVRSLKGHEEETFCIILGYGAQSVVDTLKQYDPGLKGIYFVYNPHYETRGCNYSLSCAYPYIKDQRSLLIVEGDSVYSKKNISEMLSHSFTGTCVLSRSSDYLTCKSVGVVCNPGMNLNDLSAFQFIYDQSHQDDLTHLLPYFIVKESMQMWKVCGDDAQALKSVLSEYYNGSEDNYSFQESGVFSLNEMISRTSTRMKVINSPDPNGWININTPEDVKRVREVVNL